MPRQAILFVILCIRKGLSNWSNIGPMPRRRQESGSECSLHWWGACAPTSSTPVTLVWVRDTRAARWPARAGADLNVVVAYSCHTEATVHIMCNRHEACSLDCTWVYRW